MTPRVVISPTAYRSIIAETYAFVSSDGSTLETGGVLIGKRVGDTYFVTDSIEPGPDAVHTATYFEMDHRYVNYRLGIVRRNYVATPGLVPVNPVGWWHQQPGIMPEFASKEDRDTNTALAIERKDGAVSFVINVVPTFTIYPYYIDTTGKATPIALTVSSIPSTVVAVAKAETLKPPPPDVLDRLAEEIFRVKQLPGFVSAVMTPGGAKTIVEIVVGQSKYKLEVSGQFARFVGGKKFPLKGDSVANKIRAGSTT